MSEKHTFLDTDESKPLGDNKRNIKSSFEDKPHFKRRSVQLICDNMNCLQLHQLPTEGRYQ